MTPDATEPSRELLLAGVGLLALAAVAAVVAPGDGLALLVVLSGAVAAVVGLRGIVRAGRDDHDAAETGDVERGATAPTPGAGFDRALATFEDEGAAYLAYPDRVRAAIGNALVEVLGRYRGVPPEECRRRIREGEWTDDADAAAFLAAGEGSDPTTGAVGRVRRAMGSESGFRRGLRHAVAALGELSGAETGGPDAMTAGRPPEGSGPAPVSDDGSDADAATGRWRGIGPAAVACAGAGVVAGAPAVVLAGGVGVGVAAYARGVRSPKPALAVERTVGTTDPAPGDRVSVTVTVENVGDRTLADCRLVDGVPAALPVVGGAARAGTVLRPGGTATLSYVLEARRGVHEFDPLQAVVRDAAGTVEADRRVPSEAVEGRDPEPITCVPPLNGGRESAPIDGASARYSGRIATDAAGDGVEFHAVRAYRPSDPLGRIDWKRYARTGELTAREFRDERATTAVVVVDARPAAYLAPGPDRPHAVDRAVAAAGRAVADLEGEGNRVGVAALGRSGCWLPPGTGAAHRARARHLLATHPALSSVPPAAASGRDHAAWLRSRLPADAQVVFVSPVCDDDGAAVVRRLRAHGYPVTAVSPDPTAAGTPSEALARVGRRLRLARLRDAGVRVVDWRDGDPLAGALRRRERR